MANMSKKTKLIVLGVILVVVLYIFTTYNKIVTLDEGVTAQWSQIETQYQRRVDLIPNLVSSVKGMMSHEKEVFSNLAAARSQYAGAGNSNQKAAAATKVEGALSKLLMVMENYPQLKSANNVQTLMAQLEGTENRISVERKRYNDTARNFNSLVKRVPGAWVAGIFNLKDLKEYFESAPGADQAPQVEL